VGKGGVKWLAEGARLYIGDDEPEEARGGRSWHARHAPAARGITSGTRRDTDAADAGEQGLIGGPGCYIATF
jgi:hypothetical protein